MRRESEGRRECSQSDGRGDTVTVRLVVFTWHVMSSRSVGNGIRAGEESLHAHRSGWSDDAGRRGQIEESV